MLIKLGQNQNTQRKITWPSIAELCISHVNLVRPETTAVKNLMILSHRSYQVGHRGTFILLYNKSYDCVHDFSVYFFLDHTTSSGCHFRVIQRCAYFGRFSTSVAINCCWTKCEASKVFVLVMFQNNHIKGFINSLDSIIAFFSFL